MNKLFIIFILLYCGLFSDKTLLNNFPITRQHYEYDCAAAAFYGVFQYLEKDITYDSIMKSLNMTENGYIILILRKC